VLLSENKDRTMLHTPIKLLLIRL